MTISSLPPEVQFLPFHLVNRMEVKRCKFVFVNILRELFSSVNIVYLEFEDPPSQYQDSRRRSPPSCYCFDAQHISRTSWSSPCEASWKCNYWWNSLSHCWGSHFQKQGRSCQSGVCHKFELTMLLIESPFGGEQYFPSPRLNPNEGKKQHESVYGKVVGIQCCQKLGKKYRAGVTSASLLGKFIATVPWICLVGRLRYRQHATALARWNTTVCRWCSSLPTRYGTAELNLPSRQDELPPARHRCVTFCLTFWQDCTWTLSWFILPSFRFNTGAWKNHMHCSSLCRHCAGHKCRKARRWTSMRILILT